MRIYRVLPDLSRTRHMKIWHRALRSQWSATDLDWETPQRITSPRLKDQLGRILSPVLMGEQSALYSVSGLIPILGQQAEIESQFYLTTWAVDEARHTELFTLFYRRIDRQPLSIRRFPAGYLFQSQIVSDEAGEWLSGVLVSEVTAKKLMEEFRRLDLDPLLSKIADGILLDEARHLGFNHIYLEDKFSALYAADDGEAQAYADRLNRRLDKVFEYLEPALAALDAELGEIGIDRRQLFEGVGEEARRRLRKSIAAGERIAQGKAEAARLEEAAIVGA